MAASKEKGHDFTARIDDVCSGVRFGCLYAAIDKVTAAATNNITRLSAE